MRKLFWALVILLVVVLSLYEIHLIWESDLPLWLKIILT